MKKLLVCSIAIAMVLGFGVSMSNAYPKGPYIDDGGIGDLLLFSLYDVRVNLEIEGGVGDGTGSWENFIAIENTSGAWTAFHLRFRAWKKSIEVWDHVILLSPFDVFWMVLQKDDTTGVKLFSADTETLLNSALIYSPETSWTSSLSSELLEKNGFCQGFGEDADAKQDCLFDEMRTGYIEAIGMFQLEIPQYDQGFPATCTSLSSVDTCHEDVHTLGPVVADLNPINGGNPTGYVNVLDVLDALFYAYIPTSAGPKAGYKIGDLASRQVYAAWPYYNGIQIGGQDGPVDQNTEEGYDYKTRRGLDCANVLAGVVFMTDEDTGRLQMENFIAVRNFRTERMFDHAQPFYSYVAGQGAVCGEPGVNDISPPTPLQAGDCIAYAGAGLPGGAANWEHRDGYHGGIFYPASVLKWFYGFQRNGEDIVTDWVFAGGTDATFLWAYTQSTWGTVAGPTLVDGDHLTGVLWNDIYVQSVGVTPWAAGPFALSLTDLPRDWYGFTRALGALGPPGVFPGYFVHYLNDIWSLDDIELALQKADIWYTHWTTRFGEDGALVTTNTDVVLTYPTKHFHWFFADYPIMWQWRTAPLNIVGGSSAWKQYIANLNDYRGDLIDEPWATGLFGYKDVEEYDPEGFENEWDRPQNRIPGFNQTGKTIKEWFGDEATYRNGPIRAEALVYDMNQNLAGAGGTLPPPPSPWPPSPGEKFIPHEVNIIRVGAEKDHTEIGLGDAYYLLTLANQKVAGCDETADGAECYPFRKGHFRISMSELQNGQRGFDVWFGLQGDPDYTDYSIYAQNEDGKYWLPPIGIVIQGNESENGGAVCQTIRSGMAEWHYVEFEQRNGIVGADEAAF